MNAWKTITLVAAMLALAAPVASASFDTVLPTKAPHAKKTHHHGALQKATSKKSNGGVVVMIITAPPLPAGTQQIYDPQLDCESTGTNCTDAQLCDLWAVNCDLAAAEQQAAATENQGSIG